MNPVNPDYFIYFKNASIPVSTSTGNHGAYLRFSTYEHIKKYWQRIPKFQIQL